MIFTKSKIISEIFEKSNYPIPVNNTKITQINKNKRILILETLNKTIFNLPKNITIEIVKNRTILNSKYTSPKNLTYQVSNNSTLINTTKHLNYKKIIDIKNSTNIELKIRKVGSNNSIDIKSNLRAKSSIII